MSKVVKLQYFNECRRLGRVPKDINELKYYSKDLFSILNPAFQYKDEDGDTILFDKDDEYKIALNVTDKVLRLTVLDYTEMVQNRIQLSFSSNTSHETQTTFDIKRKSKKNVDAEVNGIKCNDVAVEAIEYKDLTDQIDKIFDMRLKKIDILCKECGKDILHVAFICSECKSFALCEKCQNMDLHEHVLIKAYGDDALTVYNKKDAPLHRIPNRRFMTDPARALSKSPRNTMNVDLIKTKSTTRCSVPVESNYSACKSPLIDKNIDEIEKESGWVMRKFIALGFTDINIVLEAMKKGKNNFNKACEILFDENSIFPKTTLTLDTQNRSGMLAKLHMEENLQTLKILGFDDSKSFSALIKNNYDIVKTIEHLLTN